MKQVFQSSLLIGLFVVGVLAYPTWHKAHCTVAEADCPSHQTGKTSHDDSCPNPLQGHDATHCPVCQVVNTPLLVTIPLVSPVAIALPIGNLPFPVFNIPSSELRGAAMARAPPAA